MPVDVTGTNDVLFVNAYLSDGLNSTHFLGKARLLC